ncbi:hypothetical protein LZ30DRAFT_225593 [Colletotrichum cereale]|nr:hypothetical protein LZ30DRAFT_225593 [Colletotrichum cereale]
MLHWNAPTVGEKRQGTGTSVQFGWRPQPNAGRGKRPGAKHGRHAARRSASSGPAIAIDSHLIFVLAIFSASNLPCRRRHTIHASCSRLVPAPADDDDPWISTTYGCRSHLMSCIGLPPRACIWVKAFHLNPVLSAVFRRSRGASGKHEAKRWRGFIEKARTKRGKQDKERQSRLCTSFVTNKQAFDNPAHGRIAFHLAVSNVRLCLRGSYTTTTKAAILIIASCRR